MWGGIFLVFFVQVSVVKKESLLSHIKNAERSWARAAGDGVSVGPALLSRDSAAVATRALLR